MNGNTFLHQFISPIKQGLKVHDKACLGSRQSIVIQQIPSFDDTECTLQLGWPTFSITNMLLISANNKSHNKSIIYKLSASSHISNISVPTLAGIFICGMQYMAQHVAYTLNCWLSGAIIMAILDSDDASHDAMVELMTNADCMEGS